MSCCGFHVGTVYFPLHPRVEIHINSLMSWCVFLHRLAWCKHGYIYVSLYAFHNIVSFVERKCVYTVYITVVGKKSAVHACLFFLLLAIPDFSPFTSCSTHHRSVIHKGKPVTLCSNSGPDRQQRRLPALQIGSRLLSSVPDGQLGSTDRSLSSTQAYKATSERGHNGAPSPWELRRMWRGQKNDTSQMKFVATLLGNTACRLHVWL